MPAATGDTGLASPLEEESAVQGHPAAQTPPGPTTVRRSDTFVATHALSLQTPPPLKTYGPKVPSAAVPTPFLVNGVKSVPTAAVPTPFLVNGVKSVPTAVPTPFLVNGKKSVPTAVPTPFLTNGTDEEVDHESVSDENDSSESRRAALEDDAPTKMDVDPHDEEVGPLPGPPQSIRISKSGDGAQLTWSARPGERPLEFSVYMAVHSLTSLSSAAAASGAPLAFVRVYVGAAARCAVPHSVLRGAFVDVRSRPAIYYRIATRNAAGYGPALQVKWLQKSEGGGKALGEDE